MDNTNNSIIRCEENGVEYFTIVATGESAVSERGLARMSGVPQKTLNRWFSDLSHSGVPKWLEPLQGMNLHLSHEIKKRGKIINPITSKVGWKFLTLVARNLKTEDSLDSIDAIGDIGFASFIQSKTGWTKDANPEATAKLNRVMDKPRSHHPLFGNEGMNYISSMLGVGREHPKLAKWMWNFIYFDLSPEERAKLNELNPVQPNGHRKQTIHQWLDENACESHRRHFDKILMIVRSCPSEQEFKDLYARLVSGQFQQRLFDF